MTVVTFETWGGDSYRADSNGEDISLLARKSVYNDPQVIANLGHIDYRWDTAFLKALDVSGTATVRDITVSPGDLTVTVGDLTVSAGDLVVETGQTRCQYLICNGVVSFYGGIDTAIIPTSGNLKDIGGSSERWGKGFLTQLDVSGDVEVTGNGNTLKLYYGEHFIGLKAPYLIASSTYTLPSAVGTTGQVLSLTGTPGELEWINPATGDVTGPCSATNNAVARFDSTTGKAIKNSVITITDVGDISGARNISASGNISATGYIHTAGNLIAGGTLDVTGNRQSRFDN